MGHCNDFVLLCFECALDINLLHGTTYLSPDLVYVGTIGLQTREQVKNEQPLQRLSRDIPTSLQSYLQNIRCGGLTHFRLVLQGSQRPAMHDTINTSLT